MKIKGFQDTINWYNKNAKKYDTESVQNVKPIEQIDEFIKLIPKDSKVLDAGCGPGRDTKLITDRGVSVMGIDLSTELIKIARKKYPNIKFIVGNFLNLPFPIDHFGGVWAHASLIHFETVEDVVKALKEFYRVLTPGGILHLFVREKTANKKFDIVSDVLSKYNRLFQYFTKEEIEDYLKKVGFKVTKLVECYDPAGRSDVKWILSLARKEI